MSDQQTIEARKNQLQHFVPQQVDIKFSVDRIQGKQDMRLLNRIIQGLPSAKLHNGEVFGLSGFEIGLSHRQIDPDDCADDLERIYAGMAVTLTGFDYHHTCDHLRRLGVLVGVNDGRMVLRLDPDNPQSEEIVCARVVLHQ